MKLSNKHGARHSRVHAAADASPEPQANALLQESQVHQIELEMSNEALLEAKAKLEELILLQSAELLHAKGAAEASSRAKSEFLSNMSHEIRTPLNAILGFTYLMRHADPTPLQKQRLEMISDAASHLLSVLNDILDIAEIEAGKVQLRKTCFSLRDVLQDVRLLVIQQASLKNLMVEVEHGALPEQVWGDAKRIRQALLNYAVNAVKFTEHGRIAIKAMPIAQDGQDVQIRFEVQDTGMGIEPERIARLFEAFVQADASTSRQHGGTGLGLTITKRLAVLMGGNAGASSQLGVGSTFWFTARFRLG